ncbi:MAG: hypothetical protein J7M19_02970 [Planctomycetes bacterium]|nr:hypothetical protein [Planctomycetota bacterium]
MESRTGRIAHQLTQWVGGTIILLMLGFVVLDLGLQTRGFRQYHASIASTGAEGLKQLLQSRPTMAETIDNYNKAAFCEAYVQNLQRGAIIFDLEGRTIYSTPLAESTTASETDALFVLPPGEETEVYRRRVSGTSVVAAATRFRTKDAPPIEGVAVYLVNATEHSHAAVLLWGWRAALMLIIIIGVMVAVRIPVRKFVLRPMDGIFVAAYAASKDDYAELGACPVDNEFVHLYEMFNRLMGHLSDTRVYEATLLDEEGGQEPGEARKEA